MYNTDAAVEFLCCDGKLRNSGVDYEIEKVFDDEEYKEVFAACDDTLSKEAGVLIDEYDAPMHDSVSDEELQKTILASKISSTPSTEASKKS